MPMTGLSFDVKISDSLVALKFIQTFVNPTAEMMNEMNPEKQVTKEDERTLEVIYNFPKIDKKAVISKLNILVGEDKVVETKIMPKKKADEKADDAMAAGDHAVIMQETFDDKYELKIGAI